MFQGLFQPTHLIIILVIVLIIFGPGKLPEIGGSLGKSISEFKRSITPGMDTEPEAKAATEGARAATPTACGVCHTENQPGNQYCGKCGAKLG